MRPLFRIRHNDDFLPSVSRLFYILLFAMPVVSSAQGRVETHEVEWGGVKRSFLIAAPEKVAPRKSPPLVIDLHGAFETPQGQRAKSRFDHLAKKENFVVVFPTGMKRAWNTGAGMEKRGDDDVGFLGRIIDYCAVVHNIDTRRVYVTGFSAGGFMAYRMACELPSRIAAIAPVGASIKRRYTSRPSRSLPAIIINGTDDPAVPFQGNRTFLPIEKVINEWMKLNRCDARTLKIERIDRDATDGIHVEKHSFGKKAAELVIYKIFGGKHVWPGAPTIFQANKIDDFDATQKIWEFFEDQSVPEELVAPRPNGLHISAGTLKWRPVEGVEKYLIYLQYKDGKVKFAESDAAEYVQDTTGLEMWAVGPRNQSKHVTWSKLMKSSD